MKRCVWALVLCMFAAAVAFPQSQGKSPEPYTKDEFPDWANSLRRSEIITFGIFPFVFFFASIGYEFIRFAVNGFNELYSPWPFRSASGVDLTDGEKIGVIGVSISLSAVAGFIDFLMQSAEKSKQKVEAPQAKHDE